MLFAGRPTQIHTGLCRKCVHQTFRVAIGKTKAISSGALVKTRKTFVAISRLEIRLRCLSNLPSFPPIFVFDSQANGAVLPTFCTLARFRHLRIGYRDKEMRRQISKD
jgi:hypothetical protein